MLKAGNGIISTSRPENSTVEKGLNGEVEVTLCNVSTKS